MTNANESAHPTNIIDPEGRFAPEYHTGLTKREYFAAMAMPVVLKYCLENEIDNIFDIAANDSVRAADALINALNES